ncbi:MAG: hypothetical protein Q8R02_12895 [Hyphomonadaceae bacterium]|nr:hypothetical protein [Hyphomonadaceae bacterium]
MIGGASVASRLHASGPADRIFFGGMGLAMLLTVFAGFAATYYLRPPGAKPLTLLLQVHGLTLTAWILLFVVQTALISIRRADLHRSLGVGGIVLAMAVTVFATWVAIVDRGLTDQLIFPAGAILMFVIFVTAGWITRRQPGAHKRLMLLATVSLLPPAIARLHLPFLPHDSVGPNVGGLFFLAPPLVYDLVTRRSVHPALLWGGIFMAAMVPLRVFFRDFVL